VALIEVDDLTFRYPNGSLVLDHISVTFDEGERVAVLAANGGGKTTFARWVAGLFPDGIIVAERGAVRMDGRALPDWPAAERAAALQYVGQVPAQQLTGAAFTVAEEIAFGPCNLGLPAADVRERVAASLAMCNLEHLAKRDPFTLSGGEQQRLSIGAALAMRPRVLVLDEPTSNLDPESRDAFIAQLAVLPRELTVIVCETGLRPCLAIAQRFVLLDAGRIAADGTAAHVLAHPRCVANLGFTAVAAAAAEVRAAGFWPDARPLPLTVHEGAIAFREAADAQRR
jgi:energy-coupling factor transporter ATP-binding protein EcfA2